MKQLNAESFLEALAGVGEPFHRQYFAMYSSLLGGVVTDPSLMLVPIDDHLVHRGDGVFETFKCVAGGIYNLAAHLARLQDSARSLDLDLPLDCDALTRVVIDTVRIGGRRDCKVSLLVSRGPGSMGVNPYDCPEPQVYVVVAHLNRPFMEDHPQGARVATSSFPVKEPFLSAVKHCNYLPNVLMQKEAVDKGVDFVVAFDARGCLAEGPTENVGVVTRERVLRFPDPHAILTGTTMMRVTELAAASVASGELSAVAFGDISRGELAGAQECLIVGTTRDVVAVTTFDGSPVGTGQPGPVSRRLGALLRRDILENSDRRTEVFGA